jgi:GNAT superfamily N-acetyltransferase
MNKEVEVMITTNKKPNNLIKEKSPYLLQHAYNPINWYPWGEEAFAKAKAEDKPIFFFLWILDLPLMPCRLMELFPPKVLYGLFLLQEFYDNGISVICHVSLGEGGGVMDITLEQAKLEDAELILAGQRMCFLPLLERYQDHDFNPCNEKITSIQDSILNHYFYKILLNERFVGAIFVHENPDKLHFKLHTIYVLPEYQNKGVGSRAIDLVEKKHNDAIEWFLETPHDLRRNHHLYEKKGYMRTGHEEKINDNLTLVHLKKIQDNHMKYSINGKEYTYNSDILGNDQIRISFMELTQKTFGLDFETWYQNGYWGKSYIPHVLLDNNHVVANVSVNIINTVWQNQRKSYIQLGTVMTDSKYRNKGLARFLLNKILEEWKDKCDAVYLFANDSVLDFYPKFGFVRASEYQSEMPIYKNQGVVKKLDMSSPQDRELLLGKYAQSNPFSALPMIDNVGLLMFYCSQFMSNNVYYVEECDAIVIAEYEDDNLLCYDIFCTNDKALGDILSIMSTENTKNVRFGFALKKTYNYKISQLNGENTTLFVLSSKENVFADNQLMFPLLSHA